MQKINIPQRVTETIHGDDALEGIIKGVRTLADPVASTLGASGRTVIMEDRYGNPKPTKDGVTVAKSIVPFDSVERMGSEIIKQASMKTGDEAGDGTTTSTVLARAIIEMGIKALKDKSLNYTEFNQGMQMAYEAAVAYLEGNSMTVELKDVEHVATISANNDTELGKIIADAFNKAGDHGVVLMEKSKMPYTDSVQSKGFELGKGYTNEVFVNDAERDRVDYQDCLVLVSNATIERIEQIERFVGYAIQHKRPITIVSEMEDEVLAVLGTNQIKHRDKGFKFNVVKPTHFGVRRKDILNDLGKVTGALVFDPDTGDNFDGIEDDDIPSTLGEVEQVITDRFKTVFFLNQPKAQEKHIKYLKARIAEESNETEQAFLKERISKVSSSVVTIRVGASSEAEQSEIADRVDDSIHATRAALSEGIVAGGGVALFQTAQKIKKNNALVLNPAQKAGFDIVLEAMEEPLKTILSNADYPFKRGDFRKKNYGVNVRNSVLGNMIDMNIIDPVKVTKSALRNGISAASTLLSTSTVIVNLRMV